MGNPYSAYEEWGKTAEAEGKRFWEVRSSKAIKEAKQAIADALAKNDDMVRYLQDQQAQISFERVARTMYDVDDIRVTDWGDELNIRLYFGSGDSLHIVVSSGRPGRWGEALAKLMEMRA